MQLRGIEAEIAAVQELIQQRERWETRTEWRVRHDEWVPGSTADSTTEEKREDDWLVRGGTGEASFMVTTTIPVGAEREHERLDQLLLRRAQLLGQA